MRSLPIDYAETMNRLLILLLLTLTMPISADEVYKSVDEHGNTVFSDQPSDDAEKIEVKDLPIVPGMRNIPPPRQRPATVERYQAVSILNPQEDETYFRSEGDLKVSVSVSPRLSRTDTLVLYLDDREYASGKSTTFSIPELDRGTHQLKVSIKDSNGEVLISSEPVTFHMRQTSVLHPQNSSGPGAP